MMEGAISRTIGILGGMGPYASSAFLCKILENTPAKSDRDHIHVVLDSHPHIPSRTRHILYHEQSPLPDMIISCRKLANYPVDAIAIPCNSAAAWIDELQQACSVPLLNIINITVDALRRFCSFSPSNVAVWGGRVTYARETYRDYLKKQGYTYIQHPEDMQRRIENFIEKIKLNQINQELIEDINALGRKFGEELQAHLVIMGCTEFGCIEKTEYTFEHVDSLDVYARYVVDYAKRVTDK